MKIDKSRLYTYIAASAAFIQVSIPQWHLSDITTQVASAILLTIVSIFTILKQRVSIEINNNATTVTYILIGIAALGGLNELVNFIPFDAHTQTVLRSIIASVIGLLNLASKSLFQTEAGKAIQQAKVDIKNNQVIPIENVPSDSK